MRKKEIIKIFMERDNESFEQANETYNDLKSEIREALDMGDYDEVENIMLDYGLEMDYFC